VLLNGGTVDGASLLDLGMRFVYQATLVAAAEAGAAQAIVEHNLEGGPEGAPERALEEALATVAAA